MKIFPIEQVGINEIDAYGIVWYGNYLKYYHQAQQSFIQKFGELIAMNFHDSKKYGEVAKVVTYVINDQYIYQTILVGNRTINEALFKLSNSLLVDYINKSIKRKIKLMQMIEQKSVKPQDYLGFCDTMVRVYHNMLNGNTISYEVALDLFEQSRTKLIGGNLRLSFLHSQEDCLFVVSKLNGLKRSNIKVQCMDIIISRVTLVRYTNRMIFMFRHELLLGDKVIFECELQLCSFSMKKKTLTPISKKTETTVFEMFTQC